MPEYIFLVNICHQFWFLGKRPCLQMQFFCNRHTTKHIAFFPHFFSYFKQPFHPCSCSVFYKAVNHIFIILYRYVYPFSLSTPLFIAAFFISSSNPYKEKCSELNLLKVHTNTKIPNYYRKESVLFIIPAVNKSSVCPAKILATNHSI